MLLNITHMGHATTYDLGDVPELSDEDIRRIGHEFIDYDFSNYVVDRMPSIIYLRPKVPFGNA